MNKRIKHIVTGSLIVIALGFILGLVLLTLHPHDLTNDKEAVLAWHPRLGGLLYFAAHWGYLHLLFFTYVFLLFWAVVLYKNQYKTDAFLFLSLFVFPIFLGLLGELSLKILRYEPGYAKSFTWFKKVEELEVLYGFEADSIGITKFPKQAIVYNTAMLQKAKDSDNIYCCPLADSLYSEPYNVWKDYYEVLNRSADNDLAKFIGKIQSTEPQLVFEDLIHHYVNNPINQDGFKSIPFSAKVPNKKKVLVLGDSFTLGHHVDNISSGFADILLSKGYLIYNTGISGADIMQYYLIAEKYIPIIQPDVVIMNVYLGNDLSISNRKPEPYVPLYYTTNAGNLFTSIEGVNYTNPAEIYNKILEERKLKPQSFIGKLSCTSRIGSQIWAKFNPSFSNSATSSQEDFMNAHVDKTKQIEKICTEHNSQFILTSIPECNKLQLIYAKSYPEFFDMFHYQEPSDLTILDYVRNNGHFNEEGHEKYSLFLQNLIDSTLAYQALEKDSLGKD